MLITGPGGPALSLNSEVNTGIVLDGIKVINGVQRFQPGRMAPPIGKEPTTLVYQASNLTVNDSSYEKNM